METLLHDIRYTLRTLVKNPAFAVITILTLAIGIGANTAIFTVVQAALLRSLPYQDTKSLVFVSETNPQSTARVRQASYPDYLDWKKASVLESVAGYGGASFFIGQDAPELVGAGRVTADFFKVLGVPLSLGRPFTEREENGEGRVAIVSHAFWQRRLGGEANVIGRSVTLTTMNYTVVGVLPPGFHFAPLGPADVWVPLNPSQILRERRFTHWLTVIARLKPGLTMESAQPELTAIGARIAELDRQYHANTSLRIVSLPEQILGNVRPILLGLFASVGLVLLIACANVANLILARSAGRQREIAIRIAVGANRRRLVQQLLTETIVVSLIGGALGLAIASSGVDLLISGIPDYQLNSMPFLTGARLDNSVVLFTILASLFTGLLCGLFPAIQASVTNIRAAMAPARLGVRNVLVVAEVALALVLLVSAGLLMKSMVRLLSVDPGFNASNLMTMRLTLLSDRYREPSQRETFFRTIFDGIESLPDVNGVTAVDILPLSGGGNTGVPTIEGKTEPIAFQANLRTVFPNYFEVMGISLLKGRTFSDRDAADSPMVVMVNHGFATRVFNNEDALGRRITFAFTPNRFFEIVGEVSDENVTGLDAARNPVIYFPYSQGAPSTMSLVARTTSDPAAALGGIRARIGEVDSTVPVVGVRTMDEIIARSPYTFSRRYPAMLLGVFAGIALLLASIGIYGVIGYSVTQRTREMGLRMALGARRSNVFALVLKEGALLGALGVVIGLAVAAGVTRVMSSLLFGVEATDPAIFGSVAVIFLLVTLLASYLPARRATRVDPLVALRDE